LMELHDAALKLVSETEPPPLASTVAEPTPAAPASAP